jgi:hypothetical protein
VNLRSHKPSGRPSPPFVLIEGEEKAGKTYALCELSASPRVGNTYLLELGEFTVDEYGAIPGTRYEVVDHDGTYQQVLDQVEAVHAEAQRAHAAGEPPVVFGIDSMTDLWEGLTTWVDQRSRGFKFNRSRLAKDPDADVVIPLNLWNDANARHNRIIKLLRTFPGIVIVTGKGSDVVEVKNGKPIEGSKVYRVRGQKDLAYAARQWIRMTRERPPLVVSARAVNPILSVRPGNPPVEVELPPGQQLLDWLIFDVWRYDPAAAQVADPRDLTGGELTAYERVDEPAAEEEGRRLATRRCQPGQELRPRQDLRQVAEKAAAYRKGQIPAQTSPADSALAVARWAADCGDAEKLRHTVDGARRRGVADIIVTSAVTDAQAAELFDDTISDLSLTAWLEACADAVEASGMSVNALLAIPLPDPAAPASSERSTRPPECDLPRQDPTEALVMAAVNHHHLGDPTDADTADTLAVTLRKAQSERRMDVDVRTWLNSGLFRALSLNRAKPVQLGRLLYAVRNHLANGDGTSAAEAATRILVNA